MRLIPILVAGVLLAGCGAAGTRDADARPLVVATTSVLGDIVASTVGDQARVEVLLPRGSDPHDVEPSAQQAQLLRSADLVVANGLGLEEGLTSALQAAADDGVRVLEVAPQLDPLTSPGGAPDPHVWMDVRRVHRMTGLIATALTEVAPVDADALETSATSYRAALDALAAEVTTQLSVVPAERRLLVTNHDAFGYLADWQGFEVVGTVLPSGSPLAEPAPSDLAALAEQIRALGVPAIFTESTASTELARTLASEAGGIAVVGLYSDALGPTDSDGATYPSMMRTNAARIATALG